MQVTAMESGFVTYLSAELVADEKAVFDLDDPDEAIGVQVVKVVVVDGALHVVLIHFVESFLLQLQLII